MATAMKTGVEKAFEAFEEVAHSTGAIRGELIDKLRACVNAMKIDTESDSGSRLEAKMGLITTLSGLLKDQESVQINNIKINLSRKETEQNGALVAAQITQLLQQIKVGDTPKAIAGETVDIKKLDTALNERFNECDIEINDDELVVNTKSLKEEMGRPEDKFVENKDDEEEE